MNIDTISFAGIDDSVRPEVLYDLTKLFPNLNITWSVLYNGKTFGEPEWPSREFISALLCTKLDHFSSDFKTGLHLCGAYARDLYTKSYMGSKPIKESLWDEVQLNLGGLDVGKPHFNLAKSIYHCFGRKKFIFQLDGVNNGNIFSIPNLEKLTNLVFLDDNSFGTGKQRENWFIPSIPVPAEIRMAGGIAPENLEEIVAEIEEAHFDMPNLSIGLDLQSGIRTPYKQRVDIDRVYKCLDILNSRIRKEKELAASVRKREQMMAEPSVYY